LWVAMSPSSHSRSLFTIVPEQRANKRERNYFSSAQLSEYELANPFPTSPG
jgi:hypothetical protein